MGALGSAADPPSARARGGAAAPLLALLVVALAVAVRCVPLVQASGGGAVEAGLLFTDPASAYQLRRVAVGRAEGQIPASDRFLAFPGAAEPSQGPLLAGLLSPFVPDARRGSAALPVDAAAIERRLVFAGPVLGVLLVLVGMAAVRRLTASRAAAGGPAHPGAWGRGQPGAPLVAGLFLALAPVLVEHGQAGRLSAELLATLLLLAQAGLVASSLRSRERVDRLGAALAAGLAGGLALAASPLAVVGAPAAAIALWRGARSLEGEEALDGHRAGLLYLLTAAVVGQLPRWGGAWAAAQGAGADFAEGVLLTALAGCVPFLFGRLQRVVRPGRRAWEWVLLAALVAVVALGMDLGRLLLEPLAGALELRPGAPWVELGGGPWRLLALLPLPVLPLLLLGGSAARRDPVALHVGLLAAFAGVAAVLSDAALPLAWGALALVFAVAFGRARAAGRGRRGRLGVALVLTVAAATPGLRALLAEWAAADGARAVVAALRSLPGRLPSSGPWTTARGAQDFGVLAEPGLALLATWHARLPVVGTPFGLRESGSPWARGVSSLSHGRVENLPMALASTDSRYLLVSRRSAAEIERRFGPGAGRALAEVLGGTTPGLRRVLPVGPDEAAPLLVFEAERARPQGPARMLPDPARSAR